MARVAAFLSTPKVRTIGVSAIASFVFTVAAHDWLLVLVFLWAGLVFSGAVHNPVRRGGAILVGIVAGLTLGLLFLFFGPVQFYGPPPA